LAVANLQIGYLGLLIAFREITRSPANSSQVQPSPVKGLRG